MSDITAEQAAALVQADRQRRAQTALEAIEATLAAHACELVAIPQIAPDGRIVAVVQLIAK